MQWKKELFELLEAKGYIIVHDNVMWKEKKFACDWYYNYIMVFGVERKSDGHRIIVIPVGDMLVFNPEKPEEDFFEWKHDRSRGELTEDLIKNGHWEMNNWFEILETDKRHNHLNAGDDTVSYSVDEAFEAMKRYLRDKPWSVS